MDIDPARLDAFLGDPKVPDEDKRAVAAQVRSQAAPAAPAETPSTTTTPTTGPPADFGGKLYYNSVGRAAASANALANLLHISPWSPAEFAKGATERGFPTKIEPTAKILGDQPGELIRTGGVLTAAGQALDVATLGIPKYMIPIWGLRTAMQHATGSELVGDLTEAALGAITAVPPVERFMRGRSALRVLGGERGKALTETFGEGVDAAKHLSDVKFEAEAATRRTQLAEARVQAATAAHEQAVRDTIEHPPPGIARDEVRYATGQEEGPTPQVMGERLQAVGQNKVTFSPSPDEKAGVPNAMSRVVRVRQQSYKERGAIADEIGAGVPSNSAAGKSLERTALGWYKILGQNGGTATEKKLALALMDLRSEVVDGEGGEIVVKNVSPREARQRALEEGGQTTDFIPYSKMLDLHGQMRNIALTPREYPVSSDAGHKAFTALTDDLDKMMLDIEKAHPRLYEASQRSRAIVRDVEKPFQQTAARVMRPSVTATQAARGVFLPGALKDSTHAKRILFLGSEPEKNAYINGMWEQVYDMATDPKTKEISFKKLAEVWPKIPDDVKILLGSGSNPRATGSLDDLIARHGKLVGLATQSQEQIDNTLKQVNLHTKELDETKATYEKVIKRMARAEEAMKAKATKVQKGLLHQPARGGRGKLLGVLWGGMALSQIFSGNLPGAMIHGMIAYLSLKRPLTLLKAMETPIETFEGRKVAAALAASMQGWNGVARDQNK